MASAQPGIRKGSGGAVWLTQARQHRREATALRATTFSRSSTTDLAALLVALAALMLAEVAQVELDTSVIFAGRVLCRRTLTAARSSAAARYSMLCAATRRPRAPVRATS